jgi:hypothetical protein
MITIYKYGFQITDKFVIPMFAGAEILSVQSQGNNPKIWAMVDTEKPLVDFTFHLRGTGHNCDGMQGKKYVGTFQLGDGAIIFHLFMDGGCFDPEQKMEIMSICLAALTAVKPEVLR